MLREQSQRNAGKPAFTFIDKNLAPTDILSFKGLYEAAARIGSRLLESCEPGERVLLLLPAGADFVTAIYACWCAGLVPVPALPPEGPGRKRAVPRLLRIVEDAGCRIVLSTEKVAAATLEADPDQAMSASWIFVEECASASLGSLPDIATGDLGLIQYTSGSTGSPKGVALTHGNLLANALTMKLTFDFHEDTRGMLWLPPQHDMGLMGGIVEPVFSGFSVVLMPPMTFLQRPERWLGAISKYRSTVSGGPDFAYRLCAERSHVLEGEEIDLSCWRVAFCGAEKVRAGTMKAFVGAFEPCGFRPASFIPCYGLAEATLLVSATRRPPGGAPVLKAGSEALGQGRLDEREDRLPPVPLVSCGPPAANAEVVIVDGEGRPAPDGFIGEVLCGGPSAAAGYWRNPEATARTFGIQVDGRGGAFVRTGDLGFLHEGELFLTGRAKDVIVVNGKNHHSEDIEATLEDGLPEMGVPVSSTCVFADGAHLDELVVCIELSGRASGDAALLEAAEAACPNLLAMHHGLRIHRLVVLRRGSVPKTTSGKVQRQATRAALKDGGIEPTHDVRFGTATAAAAPVSPVPEEWVLPDPAAPAPAEPVQEPERAPPAAAEQAEPLRTGEEIAAWLARYAVETLRLPAQRIDPRQPFTALGFGSIEAVALASHLGEWLGRDVPPTLFWEFPTIEKLAGALGDGAADPVRLEPAPRSRSDPDEAIAIVGIGCRTAGARDARQFWNMLLAGERPIGMAPASRPGADRLRRTGFGQAYLDDVDSFDAAFFAISADEARAMDPQQRLLLECAWHTFESAGIPVSRVRGSAVGVFVGISNSDYGRLIGGAGELGPLVGTGCALSVAANRISYNFDFTGPSLAIDTACSSSLVAVHLACRSLRSGECSLALAAGVNLILSDELTRIFSDAGMLSPDSLCHSFEQSANGYVRGEGCGAVLLKPLSEAVRDGDPVLAVIRGSAVNQDGQSNGLTAPNGTAQRRCIASALASAGIAGSEIGYVEAHGTGTPLGDPIEIAALAQSFGSSGPQPCRIGSVKANVGHLESAAGIVGLIKTALVLRNGLMPPQPGFGRISDRLDLPPSLAIAAGDEPIAMAADYAAVSSFGFGGTNAHVVLERAPPSPVPAEAPGPVLIRVSGRRGEDRDSLARSYADFVAEGGTAAAKALARVTLEHRERFAHTAFVEGEDPAGLAEALRALAAGAAHPGLMTSGPSQQALWLCGPMPAPDEAVERWGALLPGLEDRYRARLARQGWARFRAIAAHLALFEALEALGVAPAAFTGSGEGALAAAILACRLPDEAAARFVEAALAADDSEPVLAPVSIDRRLLDQQFGEMSVADSRLFRAGGAGSGTVAAAPPEWRILGFAAPAGAVGPGGLLDGDSARRSLLRLLALADLTGSRIEWGAVGAAFGGGRSAMPAGDFPAYPFQRSRYWYFEAAERPAAAILNWVREPDPAAAMASVARLVVGDPEEARPLLEPDLGSPDSAGSFDHARSVEQALDRLGGSAPFGSVVMILPPAGPKELPALLESIGRLCAGIAALELPPPGGLRLVTREAYLGLAGTNPAHAAVWGMVRCAASELPHLRLQLIDVETSPSRSSIAAFQRLLDAAPGDDVLVRAGAVFARRLVGAPDPVPAGIALPAPKGREGTIVVSGGMGRLGGAIVARLAGLGHGRFVLIGRELRGDGTEIRSRPGRPVQVERVALDVADRKAVEALFEARASAGHPVTGIVHAAGVLADGPIEAQGVEQYEACLAPKAFGLANLIGAAGTCNLDFVAIISSLGGILGPPGQAPYGAANAYLDSYAEALRMSGVPATSFALGMLSDGGMPIGALEHGNPLGLAPLSVAEAAEAIVERLGGQDNWVAVTGLREGSLDPHAVPQQLRSLTANWLSYDQAEPQTQLRRSLDSHPDHRRRLLREWLTASVAEALHQPSEDVPVDVGLLDLGLTSVLVLQLRTRLQQELALRLEPAILFEHPTIDRLSAYLAERLDPEPVPAQPPPAMPAAFADEVFAETLALLEAIEAPQRSV